MTEDLPYKQLYFRPGSLRLGPVIISQMELKFVTNSYFKLLFQNLRLKLQYSKIGIFVTSHFGTL